MSLEGILAPNTNRYILPTGETYLASRVVIHNGFTVSIALKRKGDKDHGSLGFVYSVLNGEPEGPQKEEQQPSRAAEELDAQSWFENPKELRFASEVRTVGEEAVPVYQIPQVNSKSHKFSSTETTDLDPWRSTTMCLMDRSLLNFDVLSDGKYVYIFRLASSIQKTWANEIMVAENDHRDPPIDGNLLCDRFVLIGNSLNQPMEARYTHSLQKRLPKDEKDSVGVKGVSDHFFYEPTFSLRFLPTIYEGRFSVLRAPTVTNNIFRWMFFVHSADANQIVHITTEVGSDGLFDLHGRLYYRCTSDHHEEIFANAPGACTATRKDNGMICGNARVVIVPSTPLSDRAIETTANSTIHFLEPIDLDGFEDGVTLEVWCRPSSFNDSDRTKKDGVKQKQGGDPANLPPSGSFFTLFQFSGQGGSAVCLDDQLHVVLRGPKGGVPLARSETGINPETWNHVALTYSGNKTRNLTLILNGVTSGLASYTLPNDSFLGSLSSIASGNNDLGQSFIGAIDELRLWSFPFHPVTIMTRMTNRAIGTEPSLEACFHFDEGIGGEAYDATFNNHLISIKIKGVPATGREIWDVKAAPVVRTSGLSLRRLRMPPHVSLEGGLDSVVYYEQVSGSVAKADEPSDDETVQPKRTEPKSMKRGARVLLSFVAQSAPSTDACLAIIDFGLLSDGQLCDFPTIFSIPTSNRPSTTDDLASVLPISTSLLYIDAQGQEIFGCLCDFEAANCGREAPFILESAMGGLNVYFRHVSGIFGALSYDISRSITAVPPSALGEHAGVTAVSKLRQAKDVMIQTEPCLWVPEQAAVNLIVTAQMSDDGSKVIETWKGLPSQIDRICDILKGKSHIGVQRKILGELSSVKGQTSFSPMPGAEPLILKLKSRLTEFVSVATCVMVRGDNYQVIEEAQVGEDSLKVVLYNIGNEKRRPKDGDSVIMTGYDYKTLVSCEGKASGDFTQGSSLVALAMSGASQKAGNSHNGKFASSKLINIPGSSYVSGSGQSPFLYSPQDSSALRLFDENVYTMLEDATTSSPSSGIAFESWVKVSQIKESIIVAYTSERIPRSDRTPPEQQTFVLALPSQTAGNSYKLLGNVNGSLFGISQHESLVKDTWVHFACSARNAYALRFSGSNYVDLGKATDWNLSDFSLVFTLLLDKANSGNQILFTKAGKGDAPTPLHLEVTSSANLSLSYWAQDENGGDAKKRTFIATNSFESGVAYKVFVSRKLVYVKKKDAGPRPHQLVTMRAWRSGQSQPVIEMTPKTLEQLEADESQGKSVQGASGAEQIHGAAQGNEDALSVGCGTGADSNGVAGLIGPIRLYSSAISPPQSADDLSTVSKSEKGLIASWSFQDAKGFDLYDDLNRNHGKLKKNPDWILSPFEADRQLSIFINGVRTESEHVDPHPLLQTPAGRHQLTLGNCIHGNDTTRLMSLPGGFCGELDELRIWNVPRTRENVCDSMLTRLPKIPSGIAVYLPLDSAPTILGSSLSNSGAQTDGILRDASDANWHLTPLNRASSIEVVSEAPVGPDAPCVSHVLQKTSKKAGVNIRDQPSVGEYADLQMSATGGIEASYKRVYSYIDTDGHWCLVTGFRLGPLLAEWVGQVQTSPTLIGYIEGAPPFPVESFMEKDQKPMTSVHFSNPKHQTYTYTARKENASNFELATATGLGAEWQVSAGMGVETEISAGKIQGLVKGVIDISDVDIKSGVSTLTTTTNTGLRDTLSAMWQEGKAGNSGHYETENIGVALVNSDTADMYALRLQMRGSIAPLVAYQIRPSPDSRPEPNLVTFKINRSYLKQGCLDGRRGLGRDVDYPATDGPPRDASYFKPAEAFALRDRIRRAEQQRESEYQLYKVLNPSVQIEDLPSRTQHNICNSYVWTVSGAELELSESHMDMIQLEVGAHNSTRVGSGGSFDSEVSVGPLLTVVNVDALYSTNCTVTASKEKTTDESFELDVQMPSGTNIFEQNGVPGEKVKSPGAVDAYRWMTFWLEPTTEATDVFFKQVVDPQWLAESSTSDAALLRSLRQDLEKQTGDARTKAWRVLHRCTYVSRVPESVQGSPQAAAEPYKEEKKSALLEDISCNWQLLQRLEPRVRNASSREDVKELLKPDVEKWYPGLLGDKYYSQLCDFLAEYIGVP